MKKPVNREILKESLSRREVLGRIGKAAYIAPTLTVLNLLPGLAQSQTLPSGCPPFPDPDDPNCQSSSSSAETRYRVPPGKRRRD